MIDPTTSAEYGVLSPFVERTAVAPSDFDEDKLPKNFPTEKWTTQRQRYEELWSWFSGDALNNTEEGKNGTILSQYPLHINSARTFVRKHVAVLFGEVPDGPTPLVRTVARPRKRFDGTEPSEKAKKLAATIEAVISEVWTRSYGRAMQLENGKYSQFLGGSIFEINYEPTRKDLLIPLVIRNPRPDFYLPEWSNEDRWSLLRGITLKSIPAPEAKMQYNVGSGEEGEYLLFVRDWQKEKYTVMVDGEPLKLANGRRQENLDNPFGITPSVYIPHVIEGANYGSTHIEDVASLLKEFNGRMADLGAAVLETTDRPTYVSNVYGDKVTPIKLKNGRELISLGVTPPASGSKDAPSVKEGTPPPVSQFHLEYIDKIWRQMCRECDLSGIPFGEDEGSQRSGQTLALRMWPITSHTRQERTYWGDGLSRIGYMIVDMIRKIDELLPGKMKDLGIDIPENYRELIEISVEWSPQIPQDRASLVEELVQLKGSEMRSTQKGLEVLGDVKDIPAELALIEKEKKQAAELAAQSKPAPFGSSNGTSSNGSTAKPAVNSSAN